MWEKTLVLVFCLVSRTLVAQTSGRTIQVPIVLMSRPSNLPHMFHLTSGFNDLQVSASNPPLTIRLPPRNPKYGDLSAKANAPTSSYSMHQQESSYSNGYQPSYVRPNPPSNSYGSSYAGTRPSHSSASHRPVQNYEASRHRYASSHISKAPQLSTLTYTNIPAYSSANSNKAVRNIYPSATSNYQTNIHSYGHNNQNNPISYPKVPSYLKPFNAQQNASPQVQNSFSSPSLNGYRMNHGYAGSDVSSYQTSFKPSPSTNSLRPMDPSFTNFQQAHQQHGSKKPVSYNHGNSYASNKPMSYNQGASSSSNNNNNFAQPNQPYNSPMAPITSSFRNNQPSYSSFNSHQNVYNARIPPKYDSIQSTQQSVSSSGHYDGPSNSHVYVSNKLTVTPNDGTSNTFLGPYPNSHVNNELLSSSSYDNQQENSKTYMGSYPISSLINKMPSLPFDNQPENSKTYIGSNQNAHISNKMPVSSSYDNQMDNSKTHMGSYPSLSLNNKMAPSPFDNQRDNSNTFVSSNPHVSNNKLSSYDNQPENSKTYSSTYFNPVIANKNPGTPYDTQSSSDSNIFPGTFTNQQPSNQEHFNSENYPTKSHNHHVSTSIETNEDIDTSKLIEKVFEKDLINIAEFQGEENDELGDADEEDMTDDDEDVDEPNDSSVNYKVVYIPLDVLKTILSGKGLK